MSSDRDQKRLTEDLEQWMRDAQTTSELAAAKLHASIHLRSTINTQPTLRSPRSRGSGGETIQ